MQTKQDLSVHELSAPVVEIFLVSLKIKAFRVVTAAGGHVYPCMPTDSFQRQLCLRTFSKSGDTSLKAPWPQRRAGRGAADRTALGKAVFKQRDTGTGGRYQALLPQSR